MLLPCPMPSRDMEDDMGNDAAPSAFSDETVARAIGLKNRAFEAHYNAGDAKGLVEAYFARDQIGALVSPPGGMAPVQGREEIVSLFTGMVVDAPSIQLRSESIVTSGDLAFELGRAYLRLANGANAIGRFTVCWVRENGEWWARADFFAQDGWSDSEGAAMA